MDGWSGAGQRDYHYSLYNKRKFEEVCGINLDMLPIIYYSMLSNCKLLHWLSLLPDYLFLFQYPLVNFDLFYCILSSDALFIPQAEDVDLNAHLHGNWTLVNAKSRLHQYLQQNRLPADFKYSAGGPDHNRYASIGCC